MRDAIRHFTAEFIGIFALVFVGSGAIMMARHTNSATPLILAATAHGLILAVMVTATMRISGHLNPAVTIGFLVTRRIEPMMAAIYICAQVLGAITAAYALKATVPAELFAAARGGGQSISLDVTAAQGFFLELIATFFLTLSAAFFNSYFFIGFLIALTTAWCLVNTALMLEHPVDPFPYQFFNLALAILVALQGPLIVMSQNRSAEKDRAQAETDFQVNLKNEVNIETLLRELGEMRAEMNQRMVALETAQRRASA